MKHLIIQRRLVSVAASSSDRNGGAVLETLPSSVLYSLKYWRVS